MKTLAIILSTTAALALPGPVHLRAQGSADAAALAQAEYALKTAQDEAQKAQEDARRALDDTRAQIEHTREQVRHQTAAVVPAPPGYVAGASAGVPPPPGYIPGPAAPEFSTRLQNIITRATVGGGPGKPLVIQTSSPDPKEQANLEEDLSVMAHILDKSLEDVPGTQWRGGGGARAMGIDVLMSPGSGPARNMYLDGYGALFLVNVAFPLVPPAAKGDEPKPSGDSTWEEAKQELYGGGPGARAPLPPAEEFSQDKVNKLKTTLLEALKNAANIRGLKSDESVTICVQGGPGAAAPRGRRGPRSAAMSGGGGFGGNFVFTHSSGPTQGTIMTIRVKKTDVDAFAKGKVDLDEFQKRARITTYATSGEAGNSEMGSGGSASAGSGGGGVDVVR